MGVRMFRMDKKKGIVSETMTENYYKNIDIPNIVTLSYLQTVIWDFIDATQGFHDVDDCEVEGRTDCQMCQTIKHYRKLL